MNHASKVKNKIADNRDSWSPTGPLSLFIGLNMENSNKLFHAVIMDKTKEKVEVSF